MAEEIKTPQQQDQADFRVNTRICLKHDLEKNWSELTNFIPRAGELIIYDAETDADIPTGRNFAYTMPRFRVGDGKTKINDLPFSEGNVSEEQLEIMLKEVFGYDINGQS